MYMIGIFTGLAMLLTIVLLSLLVLILSIILRKLLEPNDENSIVIKIEKYNLQENVKKRKKKRKKKHKLNNPQLLICSEENRDIEQTLPEKTETSAEKPVNTEEPLQKKEEKNVCEGIKIKILDPNSLFQAGSKIQFEENINGNMVIFGEKDGKFLVKPVASSIGEKDYKFAALGNCFEINQEIRSGCTYKITEVRQPCLMEKKDENYMVYLKGVLCIEQEDG